MIRRRSKAEDLCSRSIEILLVEASFVAHRPDRSRSERACLWFHIGGNYSMLPSLAPFKRFEISLAFCEPHELP